MNTIVLISKEQIPQLTFGNKEVISDADARNERLHSLYRSQTLGNLLQTKVKITFEAADEQVYVVDTTVWAVGNRFISLKGGIFLPIHAIHHVD
ncbi:hypothetical protein J0A68_17360 [Algoriphagus sp. H41]|uniref:Uncharacterized protein n=1 Tax=Algoriphagus oliviformis TaxID=2811231 RepID=A0ABS3C841_9BACT|nr:hypothetical protein [Algoriphagus oliviformis]MBN7812726.1 hypothetical protein [Algoriphagus oliviformis]